MTVMCAAGLHWAVCGVLEERTLKMECWEAVNSEDCAEEGKSLQK